MAYQWKEQLNRLMKAGATYADVRYYPKDDSLFMLMRNGNMLSFGQGRESGFGVRVLADGAWGFAASSNMADITGTFDKALSNARAAARRLTRPIRLADKEALSGSFTSPADLDTLTVQRDVQADFLQKMDRALQQTGVSQRLSYISAQSKTMEYYDTEGAQIVKNIRELFPTILVRGKDVDGETQERKYSPPRLGKTRGYEIMREEHWLPEAERIVRELNQTLVAPKCPHDVRSVILMPDQMFCRCMRPSATPWSWTASWAMS